MARPLRVVIAPSLLCADLLSVGAQIDALKIEDNESWLHVDVMDGHFVPNITFGPDFVRALRGRYEDAFLDVHLMIERPEDFIEPFAKAGASLISVHIEATRHIHRLLSHIKEAGAKPAIAINPGTPLETLYPVLHLADLVLLMSVNPGFGGQKFIPQTIDKLTSLARYREVNGLDFLIEMDGGLNADNAQGIVKGGCDVIVAGNAIFKSQNPYETLIKMRQNCRR